MNKINKILSIVRNEGNYKIFVYKNYNCVILRNPMMGHLCGYVCLPVIHKLFENDDEIENIINCHGGITYTSNLLPTSAQKCLLPDFNFLNSLKNTYWIGFDCGHYGDYMPFMNIKIQDFIQTKALKNDDELNTFNCITKPDIDELILIDFEDSLTLSTGKYRTIEYVSNECKSIVNQLIEI